MTMHSHNAPDCPSCGSHPRLVGVTPRLGTYPELLTLRCGACGEVFTTPVESEPSPTLEDAEA
jgi:uncharacterized Zn finger protein